MHFVLGGMLLYLLGYLFAASQGYEINPGMLLFGYVVLFFAHLSVSYSNDYFDSDGDRNGKPSLFSGGSGVLVEYPQLKEAAKKTAYVLIILSLISALLFVYYYSHSPIILVFALIGNIMGYYYSAPPIKLSHNIFGGAALALTICVIVPGYGFFVAAKTLTNEFLLFSVPLFFHGISFSVAVQIPDIESDRINKKIGYALLYGAEKTVKTIAAANLFATLSLVGLYLLSQAKNLFSALTLISLIPLSASIYAMKSRRDATYKSELMISAVFLYTVLADIYLITLLKII